MIFRCLTRVRASVAAGATLCVVVAGLTGCASPPKRFDVWQAMDVVQSRAPKGYALYTKFMIPRGTDPKTAAPGLAKTLKKVADQGRQIAILGPNPVINAKTTLAALSRFKSGELDGLSIVYLGPGGHHDKVAKAARKRGARFTYAKYP